MQDETKRKIEAINQAYNLLVDVIKHYSKPLNNNGSILYNQSIEHIEKGVKIAIEVVKVESECIGICSNCKSIFKEKYLGEFYCKTCSEHFRVLSENLNKDNSVNNIDK